MLKLLSMVFVLVAMLLSSVASRADVQYLFVGEPYTSVVNFTSPCSGGSCANFPAGSLVNGWFTVPAPLPANTTLSVLSLVTGFSFSDGINTYLSTDPTVRMVDMTFSTDASGAIVAGNLGVGRWLSGTSPHSVGDRYANFGFGQSPGETQGFVFVEHNRYCASVGTASSGVADTCLLVQAGTEVSTAQGAARWIMQAPTSIPTLSTGAICLLIAMLSGVALLLHRRHAR